jgi:predicted nuclease with TOPRIM domain
MLPVDDNGAGVRVFYSEQVERDAKELLQALVKTMLEALASKRGVMSTEDVQVQQLQAQHAEKSAAVDKLRIENSGLNEVRGQLEATVKALVAQVEELQRERRRARNADDNVKPNSAKTAVEGEGDDEDGGEDGWEDVASDLDV